MATETSTTNTSASPGTGGTGTGGPAPTIERMFENVAGSEGEKSPPREQPRESRSEREPQRREPKPSNEPEPDDTEGEEDDDDLDDLSAGDKPKPKDGEDGDGAEDEDGEAEDDPEIDLDDKGTKAKLSEVKAGYLRQADYTRKTQEVAADRQVVHTYADEMKAERDIVLNYARDLNALALALQPTKEMWAQLEAGDPKAYIAAQKSWGEVEANRAKIIQGAKDALQSEANNTERTRQLFIQKENDKLREIMPAIFDPTKGPKIQERIFQYGERMGYTRAELEQAVDHREVMTLWKAMRYDEIKGQTPDLGKPGKKGNGNRAPAPVQGNRTPQRQAQPARGVVRQQAERKERVQQADAALRKSGSVEDAAMAFTARFG